VKSVTTRFLLPFGVLAIAIAVFVLYRTYAASDAYARELVRQQVTLAMEFNLAIREYAGETIRPRVEALIDREAFIPELMSTSLVARNIFEKVRSKFPGYIVRFASEEPRNPANVANAEDLRMIEYFRKHPTEEQWTGETTIDQRRYLVQYTPKWMKQECLRCHSTPEVAPAELVARYGPTASFHRKLGDVAGLDTVAIPVDEPEAALVGIVREQALVLVGGLVVLVAGVALVFRFTVTHRLGALAGHFRRIAAQAGTSELQPLVVRREDEIGAVVAAFNALVGQLHAVQAELEQRVQERTAELARSNEELRREIAERDRAETALRRSEAVLSTILNSVPLPVFWKDRESVYLGCNEVFAQAAGASAPEEVIGRTDAELAITREAAESYRKDDREVMATGRERRHIIEPLRGVDGSERWVDTTKVPLVDSTGQVYGVLGVFEDIPERRRADAERESLARFPAENPRPVLRISGAGVLMYANPAAEVLLATEQLVREQVVPEPWRSWVNTALAEGRGLEVTVTSSERVYSCVVTPITAGGYVNIYGRDITEWMRTEAALRASEAFLSSIVEQSPYPQWIGDAHGRLVHINPACCRMLAITPESVVGKYNVLEDNIVIEAGVMPLVRSVFERSETVAFDLEYDMSQLKTLAVGPSRRVILTVTMFPIRDNAGRIVNVVVQHKDITEQRRAEAERERLEAQLRQSQKMEAVGQLAGGVAHDFNNILTAILGHLELAADELQTLPAPPLSVLESVRQAAEASERAARLTRQLLAFSRRQVAHPVVLDLNRIVGEMEKMLPRLLTENVMISLRLTPDLRRIRADAGHVEQVLMNLAVNARDAMPDGGRLILETTNVDLDDAYVAAHPEAHRGPHVALAVSDTGAGMEAAVLEHIFEPFYTTKPVGQGTGLGLATVYGITKQAGGHVTVYSEPGRGTTFRVYWPAVDAPVAEPRAAVMGERGETGTETVLLCEDDAAVRHLAAQFLQEAGYDVVAAASGAEAFALAREHPHGFALLVTDVIMPALNGLRLSEALAQEQFVLRTLFISGYTANVIAHHGVLDEGVEFLEKPFTRVRLLQRVREVLDHRPPPDEKP